MISSAACNCTVRVCQLKYDINKSVTESTVRCVCESDNVDSLARTEHEGIPQEKQTIAEKLAQAERNPSAS